MAAGASQANEQTCVVRVRTRPVNLESMNMIAPINIHEPRFVYSYSDLYPSYCIKIHKKMIDIPSPDLYHDGMANNTGEVKKMDEKDCVRYGYGDIPCKGEVLRSESLAGTGALVAMCNAHYAQTEERFAKAAQMVREAEWSEYEIAMGLDN